MAQFVFAQYPLKFKKVNTQFAFYLLGKKSDTLKNNSLFLLIVPDSLKPNFSLKITNARFDKTGNDSIYKLSYLPGLNYELLFVKEEKAIEKSRIETYNPQCLINGANEEGKSKVNFECYNRKENKSILKNTFIIIN